MRRAVGEWIVTILLAGGMVFAQAQPPAAPEPPKAVPEARVHAGISYLGVDTRDVTSDRMAALKLKEARGVEIVMVDQDAPAGKAGLKEHDVLLSFNGQKLEDANQLRRLIRDTPPGRTVNLEISRDGQPMNIKVTLASRRQVLAGRGRIRTPEIRIPPMEFEFPQFSVIQFWGRNGMVVQDLTPQLGEFFGIRNGEGVLVRSVEKGSPADAAGLKAGDVIVKVNGDPVACGADWRHAMREHRGGTVSFGIVRDRREQTVSMKLPERKSSDVFRFELPDLSPELERMRDELDRMGPELQRSLATAQARAAREVERAMRDMQRELEQAQREREREMGEQQREMERAQREQRRQQERQRDQLRESPPPPAPPPPE